MADKIYKDQRVYWVWLTMVLGVGDESFWTLSKGYNHVNEFADDVKALKVEGLKPRQRERAESISYKKAEKVIIDCELDHIKILTMKSIGYPARLKRLKNPPPVLFYRGTIDTLNSLATVAVIGTRKPCEYSLGVTEKICAQLSRGGVLVISGAESGIDSAANKAAIDAGFTTVAVCGKGIKDKSAGGENAKLIAEKGLLIAEFTDSEDFGRVVYDNRNRIICALSDALLFVECKADGHGLNNIKHAERLKLPVFAVPPSDVNDKRFFGQRNLLRNGAQPAFDGNDMIRFLKKHGSEGLAEIKYEDIKPEKPKKTQKTQKVSVKNPKKTEKNDAEGLHKNENSVTIDISGLTKGQKEIYDLLEEKGTLHINQISEQTERSVGDLMNDLMMMQITGAVEESPGRLYSCKKV